MATHQMDQAKVYADSSRHIAIQLASTMKSNTHSAPPIKGGMRGEGDGRGDPIDPADLQGNRSIYLLAREGEQGDETPLFQVQDANAAALPVFSNPETAVLYLQVAGWDGYRIRELSPVELSHWATSLEGNDIGFLLVNPNRHRQTEHEVLDRVVDIRQLRDFSGENLYREILAVS